MSKKIKILIAIIVSITLFSVFFLASSTKPKEISSFLNPTDKTYGVLEINGTRYESEIQEQMSVYNFMNKLRSEGKINFTEKNYIGMGKFIETIDGIKGNGDKNWIYYVNGKKAEVGVSNYKIKPGDVVSWIYEENN